jgi:hypothetical protein
MTWAYVSEWKKKSTWLVSVINIYMFFMSKYKLYVNNLHLHGFTCHAYGYLHLQTQHWKISLMGIGLVLMVHDFNFKKSKTQLWSITMILKFFNKHQIFTFITSPLWLVLWGFWNNQNQQFLYSSFLIFLKLKLAIIEENQITTQSSKYFTIHFKCLLWYL